MVGCSVRGCSNNSALKSEEKLSFFRFPKDVCLRNKWIEVINRKNDDNWNWSITRRVCSVHFEKSCFVFSDKSNYTFLKDNVLPSLLLGDHKELKEHACNSSSTFTASSFIESPVKSDDNIFTNVETIMNNKPELKKYTCTDEELLRLKKVYRQQSMKLRVLFLQNSRLKNRYEYYLTLERMMNNELKEEANNEQIDNVSESCNES